MTQCACAKKNRTSHVLPRVQGRRNDPPAPVGYRVSSGALRDAFLLQLLVRLSRANDRAQLEFAELFAARAQSDLSAGAFPFDARRRVGHGDCPPARLSARVLPFVPRGEAQGPALSARDHPAVGELPRAWLRLENNSG